MEGEGERQRLRDRERESNRDKKRDRNVSLLCIYIENNKFESRDQLEAI